MVKISAEIVNGRCPTCEQLTMLVGLTPEMFVPNPKAGTDIIPDF